MPPPYAVPRGGDLPADPAPQVAPSRRELVRSGVAALVNGREVVTVAGQRGIGKTTMLHAIATALNADDFIAVQVDGARCSRDELHRLMGAALGVAPDKPVEATDLLRALLDQRYRMELVILLDDADALTSAMSRYLRVLLDVFNNLEPNLHLVLAGAAETWDGLRQLDAETFEKIAPAPLAIDAFTEEEAEAYLKQSLSLQQARSRRVIMTGWRSRSILRKAQGNPAAIDAALAQAGRRHVGRNGRDSRQGASLWPGQRSGGCSNLGGRRGDPGARATVRGYHFQQGQAVACRTRAAGIGRQRPGG